MALMGMNSKPSKHHYHEETWKYNLKGTAIDVDNTVIRVPQGNFKNESKNNGNKKS